jgi:hypothetical protein
MTEMLRDLGQTVFTGPWSTVWPLLVMPILAVLFLGRTLKKIEALWFDPTLQANASAVAACLPGVITFSLAIFAIRSMQSFSPETWRCYVKLFGPLLVAGFFFLRATTRSSMFETERYQFFCAPRVVRARAWRKLGRNWESPSANLATAFPCVWLPDCCVLVW